MAATVLLLLGVLTAGAFWEQLNIFFTQVHDTYTKLYVTPRAPEDLAPDIDIPSDWTSYWYPQDMPEGYVFSDAYNADGAIKAIVFSNDEARQSASCNAMQARLFSTTTRRMRRRGSM